MKRILIAVGLSALALAPTPAVAEEVLGTWTPDSGTMHVKFEPCGDAVCGQIAWLKPGTATHAKIGQKVFFDMHPTGANAWTGHATDPNNGTTYSGKMSISGSILTTSGCVIGGLICKSLQWTRVED